MGQMNKFLYNGIVCPLGALAFIFNFAPIFALFKFTGLSRMLLNAAAFGMLMYGVLVQCRSQAFISSIFPSRLLLASRIR